MQHMQARGEASSKDKIPLEKRELQFTRLQASLISG